MGHLGRSFSTLGPLIRNSGLPTLSRAGQGPLHSRQKSSSAGWEKKKPIALECIRYAFLQDAWLRLGSSAFLF